MAMKKKKRRALNKLIFACVALALMLVYMYKASYLYYYENSNTNTTIFSYITKVSDELNSILRKSVNATNRINRTSKVLYTKGIGSAFLKNNKQSNEYNYVVGIHLGKYRYDGNNLQNIASGVYQSIIETKNQIPEELKGSKFYALKELRRGTTTIDTDILASGIKNVHNKTPYTTRYKGINYYLDKDEVLLLHYNPIILYTKDLTLDTTNKDNILRKITIYEEYYFDLEDVVNKKVTQIKVLPAENYYPNSKMSLGGYTNFIGILNNKNNIDNDKFFDNLIENYAYTYINPKDMTSESAINPVKFIESVALNADMLKPILPRYIHSEIIQNAKTILESDSIKLYNTYYSSIDILNEIANSQQTYNELKENGELKQLIKDMEQILMQAINNDKISLENIKPLFPFQKRLNASQNNIKSLREILEEYSYDIKLYLNDLIVDNIPTKDKFVIYSIYMDKLLENAGIHHIKADLEDNITILNDRFVENIPTSDYGKVKVYNASGVLGSNIRFSHSINQTNDYWISYRPTDMQKVAFENIKKQIIQSKNEYKTRIKYGFKK